jgi:hypothetical protein
MGKVRSLAACVVVTCTACTSFAETAECSAPPLLTMTGDASDPVASPPTIELWHPDGGSEVLSDEPAASWPVMSPDGEIVAFALGEGEWHGAEGWDSSRVALLSVSSGDVTLASREMPGAEVSNLEWSSNGAEIAFLRVGPDVREIAAVDIETGEERRVIPLSEGEGDFTWSPDGTEMLVPARVAAGVELRRYFLGSGHNVVVTTVETGIRKPSWSPGGRWVALQTFIPGTDRLRLFVLDSETGEMLPVDLRQGGPESLTWSGPFLLYTYDVGPELTPALMSWDSRTLRRTTVERPGLDRFVLGPISAPRCDSAAV